MKRNEASFTQTTLYGTVQDLQLNGTYASGDVSVNTNLGIIDQHPRAEVNLDYPAGTDRWSGRQRQHRALHNLEQIPDLQQRIDQAKTDLANYVSDFKTESAKRLANAKFAERGLALDEEQMKLSQQALDSAQQDVDKLKQALQNPKQQDKGDLQKQMTQALNTLQRSQSDLLNASAAPTAAGATMSQRVQLPRLHRRTLEGEDAVSWGRPPRGPQRNRPQAAPLRQHLQRHFAPEEDQADRPEGLSRAAAPVTQGWDRGRVGAVPGPGHVEHAVGLCAVARTAG